MIITSILTIIFAAVGMFFMFASLFGLVVYPDFYSRLHVQGVGDTIGAALIMLAMILQTGICLLSLKIFLVFVIILLTNPLGTNMIMIASINQNDYQKYYLGVKEAQKRFKIK